jgi:hypothetical protein
LGGDLLEWLEPVSREVLAAHLLSADILLVSQRQEWTGIVVPSKYQTACALSRPVLFDGPIDSAVGQWIHAGDTGWVLSARDMANPATLLRKMMDRTCIDAKGKRAYKQAQGLFDAQRNCSQIADVVEQAGYDSRRGAETQR